MQSTMDAANLHRVESSELAEVQSIESSKVDYAEVFEEKFREVDITLSR